MAQRTHWSGPAYQLLLALLILLLPVQFSVGLDIRIAPSDFVLVLLVLFGGVHIITSRADWSVWHLLLLATFSAALLHAAIRYGQVSRWALINKYVGLLLLLILYLVVVQYARSLPAIQRIAKLVTYSVFIQAAIALPLYFLGLAWEPLRVYRIQGLAADPNAYGGLIVVALALHWATVNTPGRLIPRRLAWAVTIVLLTNLLLCFSRSAWIGFLFVLCAVLLFRRRAWAHVIFPFLLGTVVVLVFFRSYFLDDIWPLIARPSQVSGRVVIISDAFEVFLQHPLFGSGLGSYMEEYGLQVHNTFFWTLAEMGVIGAVVFVGFVGAFVVRGYQAYRRAGDDYRGLMAGLLLGHIAMIGLSVGIEAFYQRSWWVVMALLNAGWVALVRRGGRSMQAASRDGGTGGDGVSAADA